MSIIIRTAAAPNRATATLTLSTGLITIPLSLYTSIEPTSVGRREFFRGDPGIGVGRSPIRRDTGEVIDYADVTRMTQAADGTWVELTDDEIADCTIERGTCEVVCFVPVKDAGRYLTDGLYQLRPKREKRGGSAAEAAFGLLLAGMKARKVHALVRFAMRGPARYGLLTVDGDLFTLATADAIREALPMPAVKPERSQVAMVCSLIDAIGIDAPRLDDETATAVSAYVNEKAARSGPPAQIKAVKAVAQGDLMEALQASIDAAKKGKVA